jgi:FKBP-type peptidyl-prolyl cis-trans isomerase FkpA
MRSSLLWVIVISVAVLGASSARAADAPERLQVVDRRLGSGAVARNGREVEMNYTGWLYDTRTPDHHGARIDSSHDHGHAITFTLGEGKVIAGWDRGIKGMRVGGKRTLLIPANLGYGARGVGTLVPPHAALVFDIELLSVR